MVEMVELLWILAGAVLAGVFIFVGMLVVAAVEIRKSKKQMMKKVDYPNLTAERDALLKALRRAEETLDLYRKATQRIVSEYVSIDYCSMCNTYLQGKDDPYHDTTYCNIAELQLSVKEAEKFYSTGEF